MVGVLAVTERFFSVQIILIFCTVNPFDIDILHNISHFFPQIMTVVLPLWSWLNKLYDDSPFVSQENLDESYVPTYDWVSHLTSVCHKLKAVKSYNHFRFTKSDDVFCKKTIDSEEVKQSLLEDGAVLSMKTELPPVSNSPGLPAQRQWYLFKQIREFVSKLFQDTVFPKPLYEKTRKVILKVMRIVICLS